MTTPSSSSVRETGGVEPGRDAADVGVVAAAGDEKQDVAPGGVEYRRDDGHVGQVRAAVIGVVERDDVAWLQGAAPQPQHRPHAFAHRAEMHRDMRRVGHQTARRRRIPRRRNPAAP